MQTSTIISDLFAYLPFILSVQPSVGVLNWNHHPLSALCFLIRTGHTLSGWYASLNLQSARQFQCVLLPNPAKLGASLALILFHSQSSCSSTLQTVWAFSWVSGNCCLNMSADEESCSIWSWPLTADTVQVWILTKIQHFYHKTRPLSTGYSLAQHCFHPTPNLTSPNRNSSFVLARHLSRSPYFQICTD